MAFWKEHPALRIALIAVFFLLALVLIIAGWTMTGELAGLGLMIVGVALLLVALAIYNKPFEDGKPGKK